MNKEKGIAGVSAICSECYESNNFEKLVNIVKIILESRSDIKINFESLKLDI